MSLDSRQSLRQDLKEWSKNGKLGVLVPVNFVSVGRRSDLDNV